MFWHKEDFDQALGIDFDNTILVLCKKSHFKPGRLFYESLRGSMTNPPPSTMAHPVAADPPHIHQQMCTHSSTPMAPLTSKNLTMHDFDLTLCAFFLTPMAPTQFNPISAMNQLLWMMLKDKSSLVLHTPNNDQQLVLASAQLPTSETAFKKFFNVSTTWINKQQQTHMCIGCHVLSNRNLSQIKFKSKDNYLLTWLKQACVFLESNSLGTE